MYKKQRKLYTFLFRAQESGVFCARYFFMYKKSYFIVLVILYLCFGDIRNYAKKEEFTLWIPFLIFILSKNRTHRPLA